jgi:hypothetical protein
MKTYVLVDFENVPLKHADFMADGQVQLLIFIGKSQTKLSTDLVLAVNALGPRANYIRMEGTGKNALDFHLAYYLGQLVARDPEAQFVIVSKDTGFDPLIAHLRAQGRHAERLPDTVSLRRTSTRPPASPLSLPLAATPAALKTKLPPASTRIERAEKHLAALGKSRPTSFKKLHNTLQDLLGRDHSLSEDDLRGVLTVQGTRIAYAVAG